MTVSLTLSRRFQVIAAGGMHGLMVTWREPVREADGAWFCQVVFEEDGCETRIRRIGGQDAVQALVLALQIAAMELYYRTEDDGAVCWFELDDDLGLPTPDYMSDVVQPRRQRFEAIRRAREAKREIVRGFENGVGRLTLNQPKALHALTESMCRDMTETLVRMRDDEAYRAVLLDHAGARGFCAGGDVRRAAQSGAGDGVEARAFFRTEYQLNVLMQAYPKPIAAIMDGVTMGGGAGLALPARWRVATENTLFAMPEAAIGLFPDVGGGWWLPRLPGRTGLWLALTGARLGPADCLALGVATHFVSGERLEAFKAAVLASEGEPAVRIEAALAVFAADPGPAPIAAHRADIDRLFDAPSVEAIAVALEADGGAWAAEQRAILAKGSPTTLKVALRLLAEGAGRASFAEEMAVEYRLAARISASPDFIEGVRAVLVDKDGAPRWDPPTLEAVTEARLDALFAPLEHEE